MIDKNSTQNIRTHFYTYPSTEIHLRALARATKLSLPTVITIVRKLAKEELISIKKTTALTIVRANTENPQFTRMKRINNLASLYHSGIVDYLNKAYNYPKALLCFGSYARGEDSEDSDIDIPII